MRLDPQPAPPPPAATLLKFGGAGLAGGERVRAACRIVRERGGARTVVVVSAVGEVTALLAQALREAEDGRADSARVRLRHKRLLAELDLEPGLLNRHVTELESLLAAIARRGRASAAERDHALASGERMSARLFAAALRAEGVEATPVDAWDLGLVTDSNHGRARPLRGALAEVGRALARVPGVPVVTGFVAADPEGRLTTLGRSGSDLTATLLAEATGACEVQLWKTVAGVMSADPVLVPDARVVPELSYRQAASLAFHGAGVLHPDALAPLERSGVPARVLDLDHPDQPGTRIGASTSGSGVLGLACRRGLALLRLGLEPGQASELLASLCLEPLTLTTGPDGTTLLVADEAALDRLSAEPTSGRAVERGLASVALVAASPEALARTTGTVLLAPERVPTLLATLDPSRSTALWVVREDRLTGVARHLHALAFPTSPVPAPLCPAP